MARAVQLMLPLVVLLAGAQSDVADTLDADDFCRGEGEARGCGVELLQRTVQGQRARPGAGTDAPKTMSAARYTGPPLFCPDPASPKCNLHFDSIRTVSMPVPRLRAGQALVRVAASSVNPLDWKLLASRGRPPVPGRDLAGAVAATLPPCGFAAGDLVWGDKAEPGAMAEYVVANCGQLGLRPQNLSALEAGSLPHVALTGKQALSFAGAPWSSSPTVLILGGSGGTGHTGIQLAKAYGAGKVITTTSPSHFEFVKAQGADEVIDYHAQNWWEVVSDVDVVFDTVGEAGSGDHAFRILNDGGAFVTLLPDGRVSPALAASRRQVRQRFSALSETGTASLDAIKALVEAGKLKVTISSTYNLSQASAAFVESRAGHATGKIAIQVEAS